VNPYDEEEEVVRIDEKTYVRGEEHVTDDGAYHDDGHNSKTQIAY
jgi:hypothetical protein